MLKGGLSPPKPSSIYDHANTRVYQYTRTKLRALVKSEHKYYQNIPANRQIVDKSYSYTELKFRCIDIPTYSNW